ncbi:hypothetical protein P153DRAFT_346499 [Dothidotthia symphoricarpi CBS 119687]|uniref:Uncharacterized protein n=1 Tax=Dothidotthia symphoricarpi CBS 119687 TaxID=1392245 RepID=A0A6A6A724_9PLEO|nr:uncharacterized protein P153DRAFT_346499 [Dothidotthia symphoricarpi CBS 119687]KAF2126588.1 hypothetical protein P153DRAFT_346499 [Dothidotthia symphoricarpi CBS 119687]
MPMSRSRAFRNGVNHAGMKRGHMEDNNQSGGIEATNPVLIIDRILRRSHTKRKEPTSTNDPTTTTEILNTTYTGSAPTLITLAMAADDSKSTIGAQAATQPMETVVVSLGPPPPKPHHETGISQTTEHLLIAAGSIGATIVVVMVIFAIYTMRKRGISFKMVVNKRNEDSTRAPSRDDWENKQTFEDDFGSTNKSVRSGSSSSRPPTQPLVRSNSSNQYELGRSAPGEPGSFNNGIARANPHLRNNSATPSSHILPGDNQRRSASTRNTRSIDDNDSELTYTDPPRPPPPTFKQFMSNRPSISQRTGLGGVIPSRFSWTNSQAPQTPHDPYNDGASQPRGRDSYMTQASEVPRFRTIDSWVNQQSNRVDAQKLKQQFRMTRSSTYSADDHGDEVPAMPAVPKGYTEPRDQPETNTRHVRNESHATTTTAPIFKHHPGNEVRFSTRSMVPSEILDMGRQNAAL